MGEDLLTPFQRDVLHAAPSIPGITKHFYFDFQTDDLQKGAKLAKVTELKDYPRMRIEFSFKEMEKFFLAEAKKLGKKILKR